MNNSFDEVWEKYWILQRLVQKSNFTGKIYTSELLDFNVFMIFVCYYKRCWKTMTMVTL